MTSPNAAHVELGRRISVIKNPHPLMVEGMVKCA